MVLPRHQRHQCDEPYENGRFSDVAGTLLATFVASRPSCPKGNERYSEKYNPCPVAICAQSKEHSDGMGFTTLV